VNIFLFGNSKVFTYLERTEIASAVGKQHKGKRCAW
jgi:hypothetical protein